MKKFIKNLSEEMTGRRNIVTGKKIEKTTIKSGKVEDYLNKGYLIISEGKEYITLKKPKKFNGWLFIFLLLCGFIPGALYLIYYTSKSEKNTIIKR